jgi:hypothetical protein
MSNSLALTPKLNADSTPIRDCWVTVDGYTVALCHLPNDRWTVTRPGGRAPFAYTGDDQEVFRLILADRKASKVPA